MRRQRSLSSDCTHLKQRYDSCFHSWFEGYLQPALDSSKSSYVFSSSDLQETPSSGSSPSTSIPLESVSEVAVPRPLITSWATAFRQRHPPKGLRPDPSVPPAGEGTSGDTVEPPMEATPVETAGRTRAQIKAEQYEKGCGEVWKSYQKCLKVTMSFGPCLNMLTRCAESHSGQSELVNFARTGAR